VISDLFYAQPPCVLTKPASVVNTHGLIANASPPALPFHTAAFPPTPGFLHPIESGYVHLDFLPFPPALLGCLARV
jgi:hypothetical protein